MNKHVNRVFWILAILLMWPASGDAAATKAAAVRDPCRLWTDATGSHTTEARLADVQDDKVCLLKKDGKTAVVPLTRLSEADRQYVGRWIDLKKELPWLDANAPFDVVELFKPIPEEENAMPLYRDALVDLDPFAFPDLVPRAELERRSQIAVKRGDDEQRLYEAWRKDPKSVNTAELETWVADSEAGFKKVVLAQQRPACSPFETEYRFDSLYPAVQASRSVARAALWQTRLDVRRGNLDRPIESIEVVLRLSRDLRNETNDLAQLVSITTDSIACQSALLEILLAPGLRREHCDRLLAVLAKHEAEAPDPFVEGNRTEYFIVRNSLYDIQHGVGSFDAEHIKKMGIPAPADTAMKRLLCFLKLAGLLGTAGPGRVAKAKFGGRPGDGRNSIEQMKEIESVVNSMTAEDYAKEAEALSRVYASVLALERKTMLQRSRACNDPAIVEPLRGTTVAMFMEPNFMWVSACLRHQAVLHSAQCLVALRRWQLDHQESPKDLETLVKAAGMKGVPIDPYSDQPLHMTVLQGEPVIYSVGPDGKDDNATVVWDMIAGHPGDYVFRLAPPKE